MTPIEELVVVHFSIATILCFAALKMGSNELVSGILWLASIIFYSASIFYICMLWVKKYYIFCTLGDG